jgi:putative spermidine/putrescine transport system ATP-binding protein
VASFVGTMNRIPAHITDGMVEIFGSKVVALKRGNESGKVHALIRPESISVVATAGQSNAKVLTRSFMGASSNIICQTEDGTIVQSLMTSAATGELHPGSSVQLQILSKEVLVTNA